MQSNEHPHDIPLADSEPVGWGWRGFLLARWVGGSFGGMYFVRQLEQITVLGWPLGYWLAAQGLIIGYVCIVAFYAWLANRRERRRRIPLAGPDGEGV